MSAQNGDGEAASVVLADICRRPEINAQIIVFANEKGGVGKSTLAFHTAIFLARAGQKVLAIDLDRRQRSLERALENREATCRSLGIDLPSPQHLALGHPSGAMLMQEIARAGHNCQTVIIDVPGHDSPIARRAIAMADKLVTPVNPNFIDLDSVAQFNPATRKFNRLGKFAEMVSQLQSERHERGLSKTDWMIVKNRVRRNERVQLERFNQAIDQLPAHINARLTCGLPERVAFRELFLFGLTYADCGDLPEVGAFKMQNGDAMTRLLGEMDVLDGHIAASKSGTARVRRPAQSMQRYRQSLRSHFGVTELAEETA